MKIKLLISIIALSSCYSIFSVGLTNLNAPDTTINNPVHTTITANNDEKMINKYLYGNTDLHEAITDHNYFQAQYLIDKGADLNIKNFNNETPLDIALKQNSPGLFQLLLNSGANITSANSNGDTLLHRAVMWNRPKMIEQLIIAGADINAENDFEETPLDIALAWDLHEIVKLLKQAGAKTNDQNLFLLYQPDIK